jgi:hypothetical protein
MIRFAQGVNYITGETSRRVVHVQTVRRMRPPGLIQAHDVYAQVFVQTVHRIFCVRRQE